MNLIDEAFEKARAALRLCMTDQGFTACSRTHDDQPESNYHSIWTRDASMTLLWLLPLKDPEFTECGRKSLATMFDHQSPDGHLPNYVDVQTGHPEYGGVGNIAGIDGPMWAIHAFYNYIRVTQDWEFGKKYFESVHRLMKWLRSHDSNNCGLIEIPEASDWADLFPRSYNVLYDEVLWYRAHVDYADLGDMIGHNVQRYRDATGRIRRLINHRFWPTPETVQQGHKPFLSSDMQFAMGRSRYLISQITPFGFNWRCDVLANIIAYLHGVIDDRRAEQVWSFLRQVSVDKPYPIRVLYPAISPGAPDWRDYFLVNLLNLPHHYHNGGIWPFVGGLWVRYLVRLGKQKNAEEALTSLARLCRVGIYEEWEFNEWAHGETGEPMGKAHQAWSAASYVAAYLSFNGDKTLGDVR